jgi:hypothetical protein
VPVTSLSGHDLIIDGFNLIVTLEAALSGGLLLLGRDGCIRDLSSVHGSYRAVEETSAAILLTGERLNELGVRSVTWLLDKPVSNSGRLAKQIRDLAAVHRWPWTVDVVFNPDRDILKSNTIAITSDGAILDLARRWANLNSDLIARMPTAWLLDLAGSEYPSETPRG